MGSSLEIFTDYAIEGGDSRIACNFKNLTTVVSVGSLVFVGEAVSAEVTEVLEVSVSASAASLQHTSVGVGYCDFKFVL